MKQRNQSFDVDSRFGNLAVHCLSSETTQYRLRSNLHGADGICLSSLWGRVLGILVVTLAVIAAALLPAQGVLADSTPVFHSDDFNAPNLDTDLWTLIDPVGDGSVSIVGAGMGDAHLFLTVPRGSDHNPARQNNSLRVLQPAQDADFEIEVKFDSLPVQRYQLQGILAQANDKNWIRFGVYHNGEGLWADAAVVRNGLYNSKLNVQLPAIAGDSVYLQVKRSGRQWGFSLSEDGASWQELGGFANRIKVNSVGVYAGNRAAQKNGNSAPTFTAEVDYFLNPAKPLLREDNFQSKADRAPYVHSIQEEKTESGVQISWSTDELSVGILEYAKTTDALATAQFSSASYNHTVELTELELGVPYTYRIIALDLHGNSSKTDARTLLIPKPKTADIELHIWDGLAQRFGQPGNPQKWVNILGNVLPKQQTRSVTFSLNGSKPVRLRLGADGRRLVNSGDFNIEIPTSALQPGANTVEVVARDRRGGETSATVYVDWQPNRVWPLPYAVDWSELNGTQEIQQVAQAVDGRWEIADGKLHIAKVGYDRLMAIGDTLWQDYQVEVPITIHKLDSRYGIGVVMRWTGHSDDPVVTRNPRSGWLPLGAIGWFHNGRLAISGNRWRVDPKQVQRPVAGATYMFKMRVKTLANGRPEYKLKVWRQGKAEPDSWTVVARGRASDPKSGSLLLIAHKTNASFGPVTITPLQ